MIAYNKFSLEGFIIFSEINHFKHLNTIFAAQNKDDAVAMLHMVSLNVEQITYISFNIKNNVLANDIYKIVCQNRFLQ